MKCYIYITLSYEEGHKSLKQGKLNTQGKIFVQGGLLSKKIFHNQHRSADDSGTCTLVYSVAEEELIKTKDGNKYETITVKRDLTEDDLIEHESKRFISHLPN